MRACIRLTSIEMGKRNKKPPKKDKKPPKKRRRDEEEDENDEDLVYDRLGRIRRPSQSHKGSKLNDWEELQMQKALIQLVDSVFS